MLGYALETMNRSLDAGLDCRFDDAGATHSRVSGAMRYLLMSSRRMFRDLASRLSAFLHRPPRGLGSPGRRVLGPVHLVAELIIHGISPFAAMQHLAAPQ